MVGYKYIMHMGVYGRLFYILMPDADAKKPGITPGTAKFDNQVSCGRLAKWYSQQHKWKNEQ
jgi:hypothetical protein